VTCIVASAHRRRSCLQAGGLTLRSVAEGKQFPNELRKEEKGLRHEIELEDDNTAVQRTHIDDEYAHAGERDPKVLITTSRDPSSRLVQFAKVQGPALDKCAAGGQLGGHAGRAGLSPIPMAAQQGTIGLHVLH
jgi:hypothetical protein